MEKEKKSKDVKMSTEKSSSDNIALTNEERNFIETQRQEIERLDAFKSGYQKLVRETGFAWGVDGNSTLNSPKIGIAKVN